MIFLFGRGVPNETKGMINLKLISSVKLLIKNMLTTISTKLDKQYVIYSFSSTPYTAGYVVKCTEMHFLRFENIRCNK